VGVAQEGIHVERLGRRGEGWILTDLDYNDDVLRLDSIGCEVALREIYAKVEFGTEDSPDGSTRIHPAQHQLGRVVGPLVAGLRRSQLGIGRIDVAMTAGRLNYALRRTCASAQVVAGQ
jgi:hypothetical protein